MAKAVIKQYGRNKNGFLRVTKKTVVKGKDADVNSALTAQGLNKAMTKNQLAALNKNNQHTERMADIARKGANFQSAVTQGAITVQNAMKTFQPTKVGVTGEVKQATSTVGDLINGGAENAGNTRDDDDDQGAFVE